MGSLGFSRYRPLGWMNWAPVLGLCQGPDRFTGPAYWISFNPASQTLGVGLRAYFLNPIKCKGKKKEFVNEYRLEAKNMILLYNDDNSFHNFWYV